MTDRSRLRALRVALAISVALVGAALLNTVGHQRSESAGSRLQALTQPWGTCGAGDGKRVDVNQAATSMPYPLIFPHSASATKATITRQSACSSTELVTTYASGVRLISDVSRMANPAESWAAAATDDAEASAGEVNGQPALLIDPAKDPSHTARGSISFVRKGVLIVLEGDGSQSLEELRSIAATISE